MTKYAVLLRGINVGGINIRMADLRAALASVPLQEVSTLLATGNILCSSDAAATEVKTTVETALRERFDFDARVVVLTAQRLAELVAACPYPADSKELHAYVTFSSDPAVLLALFEEAGGDANQHQMMLGPEATAWQVAVGATLDSVNNRLATKARFKNATTTRNLRTLLKMVAAAGRG